MATHVGRSASDRAVPLHVCIGFLCLSLLGGCVGVPHARTSPSVAAPLIERSQLLSATGLQAARVSPDGRWLSWLAPDQGVINLWIAPVSAPTSAKLLTQERNDRVSEYVWSPDSTSLIYTQDAGGNQKYVIYSIGLTGGPARALTPKENARAQIVAMSPLVKDRLLVSLNNRDPRWQDLYSLDISSGQLTLVLQNDGFSRFIADPHLNVRAALKAGVDGGSDVYAVQSGRVAPNPFESIPYEDVRTTAIFGMSVDGQTMYWRDSRGRDTAALVAEDLKTGAKRVLGSHPFADVVSASPNPMTGQIDAYEVNPLRSEWTGLTDPMQRDLKRLARQLDGDMEITSRSQNDDKWVVLLKNGNRPSASYVYERGSGKVIRLPDGQKDSGNALPAIKHAVSIRSRDGLRQAAYLTLPAGSDRDGDGRPNSPLPLVVFVHGGPWERTDFGYDATAVFLANRGYAVLAPNFRSSTGFGKAHITAGDGEWGRKMQDDLLDAANWATAQGIAARGQVAIYGGSYGGYAVLAALAFTPETFACGVDLFGASNLQTQVESDANRNAFRRAEYYRRMGDPTTEAGRAVLADRSPLTHAAAIRRPLLVAQGDNDPQVKKTQSDQIVDALKARSAAVTYLVFHGEGHGFTKPANVIALRAVTEHFLAQCLGGRAEPLGESMRASSATIVHGAEFIEGLEQAAAH